jgi:2-polyprenyl-3-methyl-5-hydroxy-6-metoxy-1,4-benzoquinol methylase
MSNHVEEFLKLSKKEHDTFAAMHRSSYQYYEKPWYTSSLHLLERYNLHNCQCIDVCSGNCEFSEIIKSRYNANITCADYITSHLNRADELGFDKISVNFDEASETVQQIAHRYQERFDFAFNLAAIEHIFNADSLLSFIHKILKPDSYLLINTPNISFVGYRIYSILSGNRPFGEGHHVRFWDYRFLRTHLFLNGFAVVDEDRRFYSLPTDLMRRAFRNRVSLARLATRFFYLCKLFQHFPFGKSWFTDELTLLAKKEEVPPVGFELPTVKSRLQSMTSERDNKEAKKRLKQARQNGWLDEHLYLSAFVDTL